MSQPMFYDHDDAYSMFQQAMMRRGGGMAARRFDEYYRCYPVAMLPGPERESANHCGKVFLPPSALEKLTRLHITYPMLFELINGAKDKRTHAGVLEFIAEEGRIYLPYWLMQTLLLETGDLIQIKSTDLPPGTFIKLQPQSPAFLEISDPKAVLENAFRNFSCLTTGDIFSFSYNDEVYEIAVLEVKPDTQSHGVATQETDLSVDFAPPVGYVEPVRETSRSISRSNGLPSGGHIHSQGTMAEKIGYNAIAPNSDAVVAGARAAGSHFTGEGHRLAPKRSSKTATPRSSTPPASGPVTVQQNSTFAKSIRRGNGPQPLRLPPGTLFFGYPLIPLRKKADSQGKDADQAKPHFQGQGQTLRKKKADPPA